MRSISRIYILFVVIIITLVGCKQNEDEKYKRMVESSMNLPKTYKVDVAIGNGDVVDVNGDVTNIEKLDAFVVDFNNGEKAFVRTVRFTIEGDPIIYTLFYNGDKIKCYKDNSRDEYGNPRGITEFDYSMIEVEEKIVDNLIIRNYYIKNNEGENFDSVLAQVKPAHK